MLFASVQIINKTDTPLFIESFHATLVPKNEPVCNLHIYVTKPEQRTSEIGELVAGGLARIKFLENKQVSICTHGFNFRAEMFLDPQEMQFSLIINEIEITAN